LARSRGFARGRAIIGKPVDLDHPGDPSMSSCSLAVGFVLSIAPCSWYPGTDAVDVHVANDLVYLTTSRASPC
jgi:hypothetical protein